jgi:hypothetical protein
MKAGNEMLVKNVLSIKRSTFCLHVYDNNVERTFLTGLRVMRF